MTAVLTREKCFEREKPLTLAALQVVGASLFLALSAQIKVQLPFTPVPFTFQPLAISGIGALLGRHKGVYAILLYLLEGVCGLPVFSGGHAGLTHFSGATGGYLLAYVPQVYAVGYILEKSSVWWQRTLLMIATCVVQLSLGTLWLILVLGKPGAMALGFYPFILGDVLKVLMVTHCLRRRS